jgi:hypothetical protein
MKPEDIINKLQTGGFKLDPSFIKLLSMVADEAMRYEREECLKICDMIAPDFPFEEGVAVITMRIHARGENG